LVARDEPESGKGRIMPAAHLTPCPLCDTRNRVPAAATGKPRCGRCKGALPWVAEADDETFVEVVERSPVPVVVDLWAPWCGPCRTVSPILEQLAVEFAGRCKVVKVNVDEAPLTSARFAVQGIPTLVVVSGGREVARQVGAAPAAHLRNWLGPVIGT
jgi:thioredoxin 2